MKTDPLDLAPVVSMREPELAGLMSQMGQKAKYSLGVDVFRFTPESGLMSDIAPCPFRANTGSRGLLDQIAGAARRE